MEAVFLLNNDAVVEPTTVAVLLEEMNRDSQIGMAGPRILHFGSDRIWHDGDA